MITGLGDEFNIPANDRTDIPPQSDESINGYLTTNYNSHY